MIDDNDVSTWPEWTDCPYRHLVPSELKILKHRPEHFKDHGIGELTVLWWPEYKRHVDCERHEAEESAPWFYDRDLKVRIDALRGSVFEMRLKMMIFGQIIISC